jgi:hypothetical protein
VLTIGPLVQRAEDFSRNVRGILVFCSLAGLNQLFFFLLGLAGLFESVPTKLRTGPCSSLLSASHESTHKDQGIPWPSRPPLEVFCCCTGLWPVGVLTYSTSTGTATDDTVLRMSCVTNGTRCVRTLFFLLLSDSASLEVEEDGMKQPCPLVLVRNFCRIARTPTLSAPMRSTRQNSVMALSIYLSCVRGQMDVDRVTASQGYVGVPNVGSATCGRPLSPVRAARDRVCRLCLVSRKVLDVTSDVSGYVRKGVCILIKN